MRERFFFLKTYIEQSMHKYMFKMYMLDYTESVTEGSVQEI